MSKKLKVNGEQATFLDYFCPEFRSKNGDLSDYFATIAEQIQLMDIRSNDIWLCSYPRTGPVVVFRESLKPIKLVKVNEESIVKLYLFLDLHLSDYHGTAWTQEIVWCIANDANIEAAEESINSRFPYLERTPFSRIRSDTKTDFPEYISNSVQYVIDDPSPRFIKTHLPLELLPEKLKKNDVNAKIIYVTRNPRDCCISHYHLRSNFIAYADKFNQFCEKFMEGNVHYGPYWHHLYGFWLFRNNPNFLLLKYEDMKKDIKSIIHKVADFLDKKLTTEQIEKIIDHVSFEKMKNNLAVNAKHFPGCLTDNDSLNERDSFIRCGKSGQWREIMSPELINHFQRWENEKSMGLNEILFRTDFLASTN